MTTTTPRSRHSQLLAIEALQSAIIRLKHERMLVLQCESTDGTEATLDASGNAEVWILDGTIKKIDAALNALHADINATAAPQEPAP